MEGFHRVRRIPTKIDIGLLEIYPKEGMMKLKSTKLTKAEAKKQYEVTDSPDFEEYPYGTRINLDKVLSKRFGADSLNAGDKVEIRAVGKVVSINIYDTEKEKSRHVEIQLTSMAIENANSAEKAFEEEANNGKA